MGLPCPGLEGQLFSEELAGRSRSGFPGTEVSRGGKERPSSSPHALPPSSAPGPAQPPPTSNPVHLQCPPLHSSWQPSSGQDPWAAAPLQLWERFSGGSTKQFVWQGDGQRAGDWQEACAWACACPKAGTVFVPAGCWALQGPAEVSGFPGGSVEVPCEYEPEMVDANKY